MKYEADGHLGGRRENERIVSARPFISPVSRGGTKTFTHCAVKLTRNLSSEPPPRVIPRIWAPISITVETRAAMRVR